MSDLTAKLGPEQLMLMQTMAWPFLKDGRWPVWHHVVAEMDRKGLDAEKLLKSLPVVGSTAIGGRSYGLAWYDRNTIADDSRPTLTVAAGLHLKQLEDVFGAWLIPVVHYLIKRQLDAPSSPNQAQRNFVEASEIAERFPTMSKEYLAILPEIFRHEPPLAHGGHGYYSAPNGLQAWRYELHRELLKLKGITSLTDYVSRVVELVEEDERALEAILAGIQRNQSTEAAPAIAPVVDPPQYVNEDLIKELEDKQGQTRLSPDKLVQLMRELNACFRDGHAYACHALVRAIIDHVPPILGQKSFQAAASNYAWPTEADRKYAKKLLEFKNQADDVMHRQIRISRGVITMHDVPLSSYINALLRVCIDQL
ncbi:hypothetical protein ABZ613_17765 [Streptomyces collinus]|uniref:hypothetical protein n=1 Tax=Streptomyces collinus TaxID=42684 RepID=UPI0033CDDB76